MSYEHILTIIYMPVIIYERYFNSFLQMCLQDEGIICVDHQCFRIDEVSGSKVDC